jgi:hypothetical protein
VNTSRASRWGLALLTSASLTLAGCGDTARTVGGTAAGGSASASASPSVPSPKDAVMASTTVLTQTTYRYTLSSDGLSGTGQADPVASKTSISMQGDEGGTHVRMDIVLIGTQMWLKMDLGAANEAAGIPRKFMHIEQSKLKNAGAMGFSTHGGDPGESQKLLRGLVDAQRVDANHYRLTLDLTQANASSVDQKLLAQLGDKAKAVPASATVDDQGRLTGLTVDLSSVDPSATIKIGYTDFGAPVTINPPPRSTVVEAPKNVYAMFNAAS